MKHITKEKGDLANIKAMADLTGKGYDILSPVVSEHLPFDFIAYKDNICYRIQVKYSVDGFIRKRTSWSDKNGNHTKLYRETDFDYYAIYLPQIDKIIYPSIKFGGCTISHELPNSPTKFYWWEDFQEFTNDATKKSYEDFGYRITFPKSNKGKEFVERRKVDRPSKIELEKLLWEKPTSILANEFGVSDKTIEKWAKSYGLSKPPRGYWAKLRAA